MLIHQNQDSYQTRVGGTFEVTGPVDVSNGLIIELKPSFFNKAGVWTVMTWTGSLTGNASNVTIVNGTNFAAPIRPYQDGNAFKVVLT